jgi:hypothetical protein
MIGGTGPPGTDSIILEHSLVPQKGSSHEQTVPLRRAAGHPARRRLFAKELRLRRHAGSARRCAAPGRRQPDPPESPGRRQGILRRRAERRHRHQPLQGRLRGRGSPGRPRRHLIIDSDLPPQDAPLPANDNVKHYGKGQTEDSITLPPGSHTLQIEFADGTHLPFDPPVVSDKITVTVK